MELVGIIWLGSGLWGIGWEPGIGGGHRVAVWGCGHQVVGVIGWGLGLWIIRCGVWAVGDQAVGIRVGPGIGDHRVGAGGGQGEGLGLVRSVRVIGSLGLVVS